MRTLTCLALCLPTLALAAPQTLKSRHSTVLLEHVRDVITVEIGALPLEPGARVAVYATEARLDPRDGSVTQGLRYAGDGRVVWVGEDLAQVALDHPDQPLEAGSVAVLGPSRSSLPTPWIEPEPEPEPVPEPVVVVVAPEPVSLPEPVAVVLPEPKRRPPTINEAVRAHTGRSQSFFATLDWADDGYGTGIGTGAMGWAWVPERGLGRVALRLEGLRGSRWVAAKSGNPNEPWAREPAVGYWLWSQIEAPWVGLAPSVGVALGVQASGPTAGLSLGLRSGMPHAGHVRLDFEQYGALGSRWGLTSAIPLTDRLRIGPRARIGSLPLHEQPPSIALVVGSEPWRQQRADGTLRVTWDAADALTLTLGGGLAGYDLLFADSGPVLDTAVELRW